MKKKRIKNRFASSEEFNKLFPVGSDVIYTNDFGVEETTKTRSEAWDLCGSVVVLINGKSGGYDVERIKAVNHG